MKIKGIENLSYEQIKAQVQQGAKFVCFPYCISFIIATSRRTSNVYLILPDKWAIHQGWKYLTISFFLGWWGLPWGPIYTLESFYKSFKGKNVTPHVMSALAEQNPTIVDWSNFNNESH